MLNLNNICYAANWFSQNGWDGRVNTGKTLFFGSLEEVIEKKVWHYYGGIDGKNLNDCIRSAPAEIVLYIGEDKIENIARENNELFVLASQQNIVRCLTEDEKMEVWQSLIVPKLSSSLYSPKIVYEKVLPLFGYFPSS